MTDLDSRNEQLNDHAAKLLHLVVMPIRDMVHEGDIFDADLLLQRYDDSALRQIAIMLAALADPQVPWDQALAWLTDPPTDVVPLHGDERYEAPRPLRVQWSGTPPRDVEPLVAERFGLPEKKAERR